MHTVPGKELKPRLICNPSNEMKAIGGILNYNLIRWVKHSSDPWLSTAFVHGLSGSEVSSRVEHALSRVKDAVFFCFDGARHDTHQNSEVMFLDRVLISRFVPRLFA